MIKFLKKLWFYITHTKCEVCRKWVDELYIYDYGIEASILGCKECCKNR